MTLPCNQLHNLRRRVNRARDKAWPKHTCAASQHVHLVANELLRWDSFANFDEHHVAESMLFVLESLWKARMELARLKGRQ